MEPILLAIETSTEVCSVAIGAANQVLYVKDENRKNSHTERITLMIQEGLESMKIGIAQLSGIVIAEGPGSYTGLRVGASAAKGLAFALEIPIIGVSTLEGVARGAFKSNSSFQYYMPMIDARRMEVYTALYDKEMKEVKSVHNLIITEESIQPYLELGSLLLCGNGANKAKPFIAGKSVSLMPTTCSAAHLISPGFSQYISGRAENLHLFEPAYFKSPNITKPKRKF